MVYSVQEVHFMITESELIQQIRALGVLPDDTITIHISLKALGEIDTSEKTGAEVVIDALRACVPDGLLLIPAHTYSNVRQVPVFDVRRTIPCIGIVPRIAMEMANAAYDRGDRTIMRSLHPAHSVVAFGKNAEEYIRDDARACSPMPESGSYRKLKTHHAKILLIGVDFDKNTFFHSIDEYMNPDALSKPYPVTAIDYEGNETLRTVRNCGHPAAGYTRYRELLESAGAVWHGKLGQADVIVCDAALCFDTIAEVWDSLNTCRRHPN
ncbi:MAG: AAC(3) family N-acetyltransferase [Ruminococcaceae bacterium]|nr:AAC(3) family N-acetyltransferase [Oscillospiraceae bacterium]